MGYARSHMHCNLFDQCSRRRDTQRNPENKGIELKKTAYVWSMTCPECTEVGHPWIPSNTPSVEAELAPDLIVSAPVFRPELQNSVGIGSASYSNCSAATSWQLRRCRLVSGQKTAQWLDPTSRPIPLDKTKKKVRTKVWLINCYGFRHLKA